MNLKGIFGVLTLSLFVNVNAQDVDKKILNWYNGAKFGMSTDKAYKKILNDKKSKTVIVAVIDSGVDTEHEDLKGKIWVNADEIPNNGIDDDKNGYIDDVNGWSFLGNADGENVNDEQLEVTRIFARLDKKFAGKSAVELGPEELKEYALYKEVREEVNKNSNQAGKTIQQLDKMIEMYNTDEKKLTEHFGGDYSIKEVAKLTKDEKLGNVAKRHLGMKARGGVEGMEDYKKYLSNQMNFFYNKDFNARIQGDDPSDFTDVNYGSNDVKGPDSFHGTHVAGIIAAVRGNGIGSDGVANDVAIMSVRAVPNGDERDKDVALAIRYAVDNGAMIINGSFGKSYSPYQAEVIKAIRYAESKGVLICHAAGNSSKDIGVKPNFPSPKYPGMEKEFTNWLEVGASTRYKKAKEGKKAHNGLAASFSNYNKEMVDVFAPGLEIYSTTPENKYQAIQGTSMASPMVAGLAALLKSYYPELDMFQIRSIIMKSVQATDRITPLPGSKEEVMFSSLSETGGIVNTLNAVMMAEAMTAK
ncbi:MAG: S8 family peptidase [Crocinitomicaceae bacterium]